MTLIGTKVINRKYDETTSYVNVGLFQNNGITCIILNLIYLKDRVGWFKPSGLNPV